jgi:hypothetical protein
MQQQQPSFGEKCRMTMGVEKKYCFSPRTLMARHHSMWISLMQKGRAVLATLLKPSSFLD